MDRGVPVFADVGEMKRNVRMAMMKQRYNVHELWKQISSWEQGVSETPFPIESSLIFMDFPCWKRGFQGLISAMTEALGDDLLGSGLLVGNNLPDEPEK